MLALYLMPSVTHYAQNYAAIIGRSLDMNIFFGLDFGFLLNIPMQYPPPLYVCSYVIL